MVIAKKKLKRYEENLLDKYIHVGFFNLVHRLPVFLAPSVIIRLSSSSLFHREGTS